MVLCSSTRDGIDAGGKDRKSSPPKEQVLPGVVGQTVGTLALEVPQTVRVMEAVWMVPVLPTAVPQIGTVTVAQLLEVLMVLRTTGLVEEDAQMLLLTLQRTPEKVENIVTKKHCRLPPGDHILL